MTCGSKAAKSQGSEEICLAPARSLQRGWNLGLALLMLATQSLDEQIARPMATESLPCGNSKASERRTLALFPRRGGPFARTSAGATLTEPITKATHDDLRESRAEI